MNFSLTQLLLLSAAYLSLLFGIAQATERGLIPRHWARHPLIYILSLGVYAGAWAVFGAVAMANDFGYGYLAYYLGICGAFLLAPVLLHPILRIARSYQLTSLADLFTFRYRSQWAGTLVTLCSIAAILSLLGLQIQAVSTALSILAPEADMAHLALLFSAMVMIFSVLFGARHHHGVESHEGLVMAIAFEALVKLLAMLVLGAMLLFSVFEGFGGLDAWLQAQEPHISGLERHMGDGNWRALLLVSFAAVLVMPHMFHMTFTENPSPTALARASWGLPLYLLLLALPVPVILWAGIQLNVPLSPDYYAVGLGLVLESPSMTLLAYLAGMSAASALMIVLTLALAGMLLNHLVLPLYPPREKHNIYTWLQWTKRLLIAAIILTALAFHYFIGQRLELSVLGIVALAGVLQLLPGVLGVIYWPEGNSKGVIAGLLTGITLWLLTLVLPMTFALDPMGAIGMSVPPPQDPDNWHIYAFLSLTLNVLVFAAVSLLTRTSADELSAAQSCSMGALSRPQRRELLASSSEDFKTQLAVPLGSSVAQREVNQALAQLDLPAVEYRPYPLRRLRDQLEANLSGLLGPAMASDIIRSHLGFKPLGGARPGHDIHFVETTLEDYRSRLTGLAAELDSLRRHYRQILQNLPVAACSVGNDDELLMWNQAMETLTGIAAREIIGANLHSLPAPWGPLLWEFNASDTDHLPKHRVEVDGFPNWFNLHQSSIGGPEHPEGGTVILVEDQTEARLLEDELIHSERLASVGRLAAGVAHEVGNPVTGIACLAQNLKLETDDTNVLDTAEQILVQTKRISSIQQSLMNFARAGNHSTHNPHEPVPVARCVQEAINLLSLGDREREIRYLNHCTPDLWVLGDEQRLVQVFINLLANARDASPDGSHIDISGQRDGHSAIIAVCDQGDGIPVDQQDHIFEPFYTTKGPDQGTGLGLSLVYSIIEEHYGNVQVDSPTDKARQRGTCIRLKLPAAPADPLPGPQPANRDPSV